MSAKPVYQSSLQSLPLLGRGKVRDNYAVAEDQLLIVTTDRLSAFDVIMGEPIPDKGRVLNRMTLHWLKRLADVIPNHLLDIRPEAVVAESEREQVVDRSMVVRRLRPILVEAVVRGYLIGSGWKDYQQSGSVCGLALPAGLRPWVSLNECHVPFFPELLVQYKHRNYLFYRRYENPLIIIFFPACATCWKLAPQSQWRQCMALNYPLTECCSPAL